MKINFAAWGEGCGLTEAVEVVQGAVSTTETT